MAALIWCVLVVMEASLAQSLARRSLDTNVDVGIGADSPVLPARGAPLADLSIPRLGLAAVVLRGTDARTLRLGLGHVEHTALPGQAGNVAIAGHRDTFFRPLRQVRVGDDIFLTMPSSRLHYQVSSVSVVTADAINVLAPTARPTLTLITCYPFWVLGNAPDRFVVRATRVVE